jgi:hypothetical protein
MVALIIKISLRMLWFNIAPISLQIFCSNISDAAFHSCVLISGAWGFSSRKSVSALLPSLYFSTFTHVNVHIVLVNSNNTNDLPEESEMTEKRRES